MKRRFKGIGIGIAVLTASGIGYWVGRGPVGESADHVTPLPILLTQVRSIGELRTTQYAYENVFTYATHREPEVWADWIPGVGGLVRASTQNEALVSAYGTVQAGFDFTRATLRRESDGTLTVTLPEADVYEPQVTARVHQARRGVFWSDANLALKARQDAQVRFRSAAVAQGIETAARESAVRQLRSLLGPLGENRVEIVFADPSDTQILRS